MALRIGQRSKLTAGPFKGVRDTDDPYSVSPQFLTRARNIWIPISGSVTDACARPGFNLANAGAQLGAVGSGNYGQGVGFATDANGTKYNFVVCGGKVYRVDPGFSVFTDVTPVGVTIDAKARVHLTPFSHRLVVNDGVNTPWVMSNLGATPVTGTKIDYTGDGVAWTAYGPARDYEGSIVFLVRSRNNGGVAEYRVVRLGWSEPDDPFTGYEQLNYDDEWDVGQNGADAIYALFANDTSINYFRDQSIGYLSGPLWDMKTTQTGDAISRGIGTRTPQAIAEFGDSIFFIDSGGRPHRIMDGAVQPLHDQLRRVVTIAPTRWPDVIAKVASGVIAPQLDLYVVAPWSPDPTQATLQYPTVLYAFRGSDGMYMGEWTIGLGIAVHAMGILNGIDGQKVLAVLGTKAAPVGLQADGAGGYLWTLGALEDGVWEDNGQLPDISCTTAPLGYDEDLMLTVDQAEAVVQELQTDVVVRAITVTPASDSLAPGDTVLVSAIARNRAGGTVRVPVGLWQTSDASKATVQAVDDYTALVTCVAAPGTANITAEINDPVAGAITSNNCQITCVDPASLINATGGNTVQDVGGYRIHIFTADGVFDVTQGGQAEVLVVGGGGCGGDGQNRMGGGGGAGGVLHVTDLTFGVGNFNVVVGAGGVYADSANRNGKDSSVNGEVARGGGHGCGWYTGSAADGGSGGGGGGTPSNNGTNNPGNGTAGQGNAGGARYDSGSQVGTFAGGGGGGASQVGGDGTQAAGGGKGGDGIQLDISGALAWYGGGGGGGEQNAGGQAGPGAGAGGQGGGGAGGFSTTAGSAGAQNGGNGQANTGGGGGGGATAGSSGGNGGSGIVIIRYPLA